MSFRVITPAPKDGVASVAALIDLRKRFRGSVFCSSVTLPSIDMGKRFRENALEVWDFPKVEWTVSTGP